MHAFAIISTLALCASSVSAADWGINLYSSKSCISAHSLSSYEYSTAQGCMNIDSTVKVHGLQGIGLGTGKWHIKVWSAENCKGTEGTLVTNACEDNQNLFGDYTTLTAKSFKAVKV
ncbi:hypothetical protein N7490_000381 [Penicillium lividum]|nr:hypothetical protein N7490_000381 [Penicillium lividum]